MQVGVVVAFDHAEPAGLDHQQMVGDLVQEIAVVADEQHGALELAERLFQGFARPQVQVIRRFVQNQEVRIQGRHAGQGARLRSPPLRLPTV